MFGGCAALALLWLGVSLTMQEPPYVSSLRIVLPEGVEASPALEQKIRACDGVSDVLLVSEEHSVYVKVDTKHLTRSDLERLIVA
ncbi:Inner membrane transport protein YajR [compost metagenome]